jgi:hypothetical protein
MNFILFTNSLVTVHTPVFIIDIYSRSQLLGNIGVPFAPPLKYLRYVHYYVNGTSRVFMNYKTQQKNQEEILNENDKTKRFK